MSSTEVTTQPSAGWVALSAAHRHLLVRGSSAVASELQGPLEAGVVEVLQALGRDGLAALPDFALVDTSGDRTRVVVRGETVVRADGADVSSDARMPWRDLDLDAAVIALGEGGRAGWRRPARLGRPAVVATPTTESGPPELSDEEDPADEVDPPAEADLVGAPVVATASEPELEGVDVEQQHPEPEPVVEPEPEPVASDVPAAAEAAPAPPVLPADLTLPPSEEYAGSAPAERIPPVKEAPPDKKVLIDSVPWRTLPDDSGQSTDRPAEPSADQPAEEPAEERADVVAADGPTGPDNWGMTGPPPTQSTPTDEPAAAPSDVSGEQIDAGAPPPPSPPTPDVTMDRSALTPGTEGPADSPVVLAVLCPAGHHSSPHASNCRVCSRDISTQQPFQTPRPQLGTLVVSTGGVVPLDRGILLGRAPKVNADLPPSSRPHLVRLASQDNDISRNHAEVILEGWHVLVRDLGSTNGTTVTLPGQEPVRLRPTEDFGIEPGTVLTLADEVSLTYEVSE